MANLLHTQDGDWRILETSDKLVLVDFWAEWCGPCRALAPTLERLTEKYGDQVQFAKVNVDELPELADRFSVRSIPTLVLLREGENLERLVGARSYEELAHVLDRHIAEGRRLSPQRHQ